jgi:hypothetical protein
MKKISKPLHFRDFFDIIQYTGTTKNGGQQNVDTQYTVKTVGIQKHIRRNNRKRPFAAKNKGKCGLWLYQSHA